MKVDDLVDWLIPRRCVLCNAPGSHRGVCRACAGDLPWLAGGCPACFAPLPPGAGDVACGRCGAVATGAAGRTLAALAYEFPVDRMVAAAKFHRRLDVACALGELLARAVIDRAGPLPGLIVPVPLHHRRLVARGYNQALEIARPVAVATGLPIAVDLCVRTRATAEQSGLRAAERRRNLRGAFRVVARCHGARVAIVDDVVTTGSTAAALARALRAAGAAEVQVWAAARAV